MLPFLVQLEFFRAFVRAVSNKTQRVKNNHRSLKNDALVSLWIEARWDKVCSYIHVDRNERDRSV